MMPKFVIRMPGEKDPPKREQLLRRAARMREKNLYHGKGCATRRKAIEAREAKTK